MGGPEVFLFLSFFFFVLGVVLSGGMTTHLILKLKKKEKEKKRKRRLVHPNRDRKGKILWIFDRWNMVNLIPNF